MCRRQPSHLQSHIQASTPSKSQGSSMSCYPGVSACADLALISSQIPECEDPMATRCQWQESHTSLPGAISTNAPNCTSVFTLQFLQHSQKPARNARCLMVSSPVVRSSSNKSQQERGTLALVWQQGAHQWHGSGIVRIFCRFTKAEIHENSSIV